MLISYAAVDLAEIFFYNTFSSGLNLLQLLLHRFSIDILTRALTMMGTLQC